MSRRIVAIESLGQTHLPEELFPPNTDGLNGLLDTYPDLGRGVGVLDTHVLGDPQEPPSVPDGVVEACEDEVMPTEDGMTFGPMGNLDSFVREASIQDLSWLELVEQDPERLPKNPTDRGLLELEQAWGVDRQTNGLSFTPNVDRNIAAYQASLTEGPKSKTAMSKNDMRDLVQHAWRRMTAGESFSSVATEVAQRMGADAPQAKAAMMLLRDDVGLIGKVFIRASNYPGCASGKWSEPVRKQAATAKYIVKKQACGNCVHAQNGACSVFKKTLVAEVPWEKARQAYTSHLEASGRKVALDLSPKVALRKAFAKAPVGLQAAGDVRPTHHEREATAKEARAAVAAFQRDAAEQAATLQRENAKREFAASHEGKDKRKLQVKVGKIQAAVERGIKGPLLKNLIRRTFARDELKQVMAALAPLVNKAESSAGKTAEYTGFVYTRADPQPESRAPEAGEVGRLLRWARRQMTEGSVGEELTQLLQARFAPSIRSAATKALGALRAEHEGLSGHAYVDASAYASSMGTDGCEKGGTRHRANAVPAVLQMDRCATCVRRSFREDGVPVCQVYNKPLVASAPVENPKAYQRETIRLANGSDAERTASLFGNIYDPREFGLGEDSELDHIVLADTPANEDVGEILFGGLEWE